MKRTILVVVGLLIVIGAALASTGFASSAGSGTVTIRHQLQHCHTWSFNNGAYAASIKGTLSKGGTLTFTNNDMMSHTLVQKSGPKAILLGKPLLNHVGASVTVRFPTAGVYVFGTKTGADYVNNLKTIGADNVLHLTVTVR